MADFKTGDCLMCEVNYSLVDGLCKSLISNFCTVFNKDGQCVQCKNLFYLKNNLCNPYPPFCEIYQAGCKQCVNGFTLRNGQCIDPNCQTVNKVTKQCQICVSNYQLNS